MRSIHRRFDEIQKKHPYWSSYVCFYCAIEEQGFSRDTLHHWFAVLVEKDDYAKKDAKQILAHLERATKLPEEQAKSGALAANK